MTTTSPLDHSIPAAEAAVLAGTSRLKLGVFAANCSSGASLTSVDETINAEWDESVRIARAADRSGFDAIIPVARWKGMGGDVDFNHRSFDTLTWAAGLAAHTERATLFVTTHVPTIHPVRAAKTLATIDHISGGRLGLNVVAGWNADEIGLFGAPQREHDERYALASEWIELVTRLWSADEEFDFEGKFFTLRGAYSSPRPRQAPRPTIMNAGLSPRGQQFALEHADLLFITQPDLETSRKTIASIKKSAAELGRPMSVFGMTHIVCRDTEKEAREYYNHYVNDRGDWKGVRNLLDVLIPNSQSVLGEQWEAMAENMIAGYSALPLVGTPEQVVEGLVELSEAGYDGMSVSWVDYEHGIGQYAEQILPLAVEAGIRAPLS